MIQLEHAPNNERNMIEFSLFYGPCWVFREYLAVLYGMEQIIRPSTA